MIKKEEVIKIGHFAKPHGIKGEIGLVTTYDVFDDSDNLYIICEIDGILVPFFLESYRYKTNTVVLIKLENIDSEERVRELINLDVYYPKNRMDIAKNNLTEEITWDNFIGYKVTDENLGFLGNITNVDDSTMNVILGIDFNGKELLIPAAEELILSVDHDKRNLTVTIPEGLLDL